MILGEAPGREEDKRATPFVGMSGKLLRATLLKSGIPLKKCYITNTVKCFPDGTPTKEQAHICAGSYLKEEIKRLNPIYILALGNTALRAVTNFKSISEVRGQLLDGWLNDSFVFPTWHPAYVLRRKDMEGQWISDIEAFTALVQVDHGF